MPGDSRRFEGPANTVDYRIYTETNVETIQKYAKDLGVRKRQDNRALDQHRPICIRTGVVSQAKGSAYIELCKTKVICSVFNPREIPNKAEYSINGELYCDFKFAPFSCTKRKTFIRDTEEREYSVQLRRALEPSIIRQEFSNFQVDIYVMVLENDGSALAASITCASLALANASIPMYDLVTAVSMGVYDEITMVDLTFYEEMVCKKVTYVPESNNELAQNQGIITVSYATTLQQVTQMIQCGFINNKNISQYINQLVSENAKIYQLSRQCLVRRILSTLKEKDKNLEHKQT